MAMDTVLDFRSFHPRFQTGLAFSMFEGLLLGRSIQMFFDQDPSDLETQFKIAQINNYIWESKKIDGNTWQVRVLKIERPAS